VVILSVHVILDWSVLMLTEEEYKLGSNSYVKLVIALPFSSRHTVLKQSDVLFPRKPYNHNMLNYKELRWEKIFLMPATVVRIFSQFRYTKRSAIFLKK
jgi:hypothetical protein